MSDVSNLSDTIVPKSDQLNAEQLLAGPITITVSAVKRSDADQPVSVHYEGDDGRPYKPCKSMRKVLIFAWGDDGRQWVGRSMTLFNNPDVKFGGIKVGGIRISHLSHIERDISIALTATKGKKETYTIKKLDAQQADPNWLNDALDSIADAQDMDALKKAFDDAITAAKGDRFAKDKIIAVKDTRKQQLTAPAPETGDAETGEVI